MDTDKKTCEFQRIARLPLFYLRSSVFIGGCTPHFDNAIPITLYAWRETR